MARKLGAAPGMDGFTALVVNFMRWIFRIFRWKILSAGYVWIRLATLY